MDERFRCAIWVVIVLLFAATLDTGPDPPAVSPNVSISKMLSLSGIEPPRCDPPAVAEPTMLSFVMREIHDANRPRHCVILTGQAADTSPPALRPPPAFQS